MSNKLTYKEYCVSNPDIPLFSQYWWMEAVCADNHWDVFLVYDKQGEIIASMPYLLKKKLGFKYIPQPLLSQTNGLWIKYPEGQTTAEKLSYEKKICDQIIAQLNALKLLFFHQNFHFSFTNWLPFYWHGFSQTTRYTYRIPDISDINKVFSGFSDAKKRHIRKAEKELSVTFGLSVEQFYDLHRSSFLQRGEKEMLSESHFRSVYDAAIREDKGFIIAIKDKNDAIHAGIFVVWDENTAYYLFPFINPDFRASGASSLIVWETIKYLSGKKLSFDFEGSMIEKIESSYRQYGTIQTPYFQLKKVRWKWLNLIKL
jgi:lipid II:glycine glycyltransferase (peptidoglycan interpeptide bridge formation enzyme)